jgi:hypothetical protein
LAKKQPAEILIHEIDHGLDAFHIEDRVMRLADATIAK